VFEAVDQLDDNMFKILCRRIVNDPRGIGRAWRDRGGEVSRCNGCANPVQQSRTRARRHDGVSCQWGPSPGGLTIIGVLGSP